MASDTAVFFMHSRCRQASMLWINAVPVSHGSSEPFSTGSQPQ